MATQIEPTTTVPTKVQTLRERIVAAGERHAAIEAASAARSAEEARERHIRELIEKVAEVLGVAIDPTEIDYEAHREPPAIATIDGLQFAIADTSNDWNEFSIATTCARRCGTTLWQSVDGWGDPLVRIQQVLDDATAFHRYHRYPCTPEMIVSRTRAELPRDRANRAVVDVLTAARQLGEAVSTLQRLEDERPIQKSAAIRRLMQQENPETNKPHSASSAEKVVESDAEYLAHRTRQAEAEVAKHEAFGRYEAAKLTARLEAETCIRLENGNE